MTTPNILVLQDIPKLCRMAVQLDGEDDFRFTIGDPRKEELTLVFERQALERFVRLASRALTQERPADSTLGYPELVNAE